MERKEEDTNIIQVKKDDKLLSDVNEVSNAFNVYYATVADKLAQNISKDTVPVAPPPPLEEPNMPKLSFRNVSTTELL